MKAEPRQGVFQLVHYDAQECQADFTLDPTNETVWATQQQIAEAFGIDRTVVGRHLRNIFSEGELDEGAVSAKIARTATDGKVYETQHYNLEAILSVGYRVSSKRATAFRQWATQTLREYIVQGFAINEARLKDDPNALRELAERVRELRSNEKNIYKSVRDVFAFAASDYSKDAPDLGRFYAKLQDKFTYAVTGQLSSEVLLSRANHQLDNMGLTSMKSSQPSHGDVQIAKNYFAENELYSLHMLCEHFLLFIQSTAIRGLKLTMFELLSKFDDLAAVIGHPVFLDYKEALAYRAKRHAAIELERYQQRLVHENQASRNRRLQSDAA